MLIVPQLTNPDILALALVVTFYLVCYPTFSVLLNNYA